METLLIKNPTARKEHKCDWCGQRIKIGEKYENSFLKTNGDVYSWKCHINCRKIAEHLDMFDGDYDEGLTGDQFQEYIKEEYANLNQRAMESNDFVIPSFPERLKFIIKHYLIDRHTRSANQN